MGWWDGFYGIGWYDGDWFLGAEGGTVTEDIAASLAGAGSVSATLTATGATVPAPVESIRTYDWPIKPEYQWQQERAKKRRRKMQKLLMILETV